MHTPIPSPIGGLSPATTRLHLLIDAAYAAADDPKNPDAYELNVFASVLSEQTELVSPRGANDRPFLVLGGDSEPLLHWAQTPVEAALADLAELDDEFDVEYEHLEMRDRAHQRHRDMEDLFRSRDWSSWTVRVYGVLAADLSRRHLPMYGDQLIGSRLPLVATFTAHSYTGDEVGPWEWAREAGLSVGDRCR
jgi:hypothetical protein